MEEDKADASAVVASDATIIADAATTTLEQQTMSNPNKNFVQPLDTMYMTMVRKDQLKS